MVRKERKMVRDVRKGMRMAVGDRERKSNTKRWDGMEWGEGRPANFADEKKRGSIRRGKTEVVEEMGIGRRRLR